MDLDGVGQQVLRGNDRSKGVGANRLRATSFVVAVAAVSAAMLVGGCDGQRLLRQDQGWACGGGEPVSQEWVATAGNSAALRAIARVYELREFFEWRGLGSIDCSGVRFATRTRGSMRNAGSPCRACASPIRCPANAARC